MRKPLWEIKQAAEGTLQLYIYGDVEGEEFDWESWRYVQSDNSAEHFREELAKHPDVSRIEIYINSYGGSVFEGTAIYNQLEASSGAEGGARGRLRLFHRLRDCHGGRRGDHAA